MTPQLQNALLKARNDLRETAPLIHCITNPIAINDCANGILAVGGKPIMAEHPDEVEEITCIAGALGVNIGNITDARRTSVLTSAKAAKTAGVPVSFDAVGVTCSALRRDLTHTLLREACPEILKGNDAEIRAIRARILKVAALMFYGQTRRKRLKLQKCSPLPCAAWCSSPAKRTLSQTAKQLCCAKTAHHACRSSPARAAWYTRCALHTAP